MTKRRLALYSKLNRDKYTQVYQRCCTIKVDQNKTLSISYKKWIWIIYNFLFTPILNILKGSKLPWALWMSTLYRWRKTSVLFSTPLYCAITHCFPFPLSVSLSILPSFLPSLLLPRSYSLPPGCLLAGREGWQMRGKKQETETSRRERMGCYLVLHLHHLTVSYEDFTPMLTFKVLGNYSNILFLLFPIFARFKRLIYLTAEWK